MRINKIFSLLLAGMISTAAPMTTYAATTEEQIADGLQMIDGVLAEMACQTL